MFADYFQFYLQDDHSPGDLSESWTKQATEDLLAVVLGVIGVGTVRNMHVPVIVEIHNAEPEEDLRLWQHIAECSIEISSGSLVVADGIDYFPEAVRLKVSPGIYRARVYHGALDSLSEDGLEGNDNYKVILWRGQVVEPKIIKRRSGDQ